MASAPAGGHTDKSALGSTDPELNVPSAWHTHPESASPSGREKTEMLRSLLAGLVRLAPTTTCTATEPDPAGNIIGASSVSSSTTEQPTSSPARIANSTKPAPGNTTAPDTA